MEPAAKSDSDLTKEDFINDMVLRAVNPHPQYGYAHGPIPNNNPDWVPENICKSWKGQVREIRESIIQGFGPANPMVSICGIDRQVCHVVADPNYPTVMCGYTAIPARFDTLKAHLRSMHPGAVNTLNKSLPPYAKTAGTSALKYWVLTGGWRDARYMDEPTQNRMGHNPIYLFCEALERIAREDPAFSAKWGTRFHRPGWVLRDVYLRQIRSINTFDTTGSNLDTAVTRSQGKRKRISSPGKKGDQPAKKAVENKKDTESEVARIIVDLTLSSSEE